MNNNSTLIKLIKSASSTSLLSILIASSVNSVNVQAVSNFNDVAPSNPFFNEIKSLAENGVISGFGDGQFKPNNLVTRGEFVKFVQNGVLANKTDTSCTPFNDVSSDNTFFQHITTIKCLGIASGFGNGEFRPNQNITRGEAIKIAVLAGRNRAGDNSTLVGDTTKAPFEDVPVGSSFVDFVNAAKKDEIVSGVNAREFKPNNLLTRGEISKIVFRVRKLLKIENEKVGLKDIVELALAKNELSSLTTALTKADLVNTLKGTGPFTVFAPKDSAFAKLDVAKLQALLNDPAKLTELKDILTYHVVPGKIKSTDIIGPSSSSLAVNEATAVNGDKVKFTLRNNNLFVNNSKVISADIEAKNGVIHLIDTVLMPTNGDIVQVAQSNSSLSTLVTALTKADLVNTLKGTGPFTVFAPNNSAFDKLKPRPGEINCLATFCNRFNYLIYSPEPESVVEITNILLDHVVSGDLNLNKNTTTQANNLGSNTLNISTQSEVIKVNNQNVVDVNVVDVIKTTNGTIYVIDRIL